MSKPYQRSIEDIITLYETNGTRGLTIEEAQKRLATHGPNDIPDVEQKTLLSIFLSQFTSPLIYVLLAAAVILFFFGPDKIDPFIISGVLLFNAIIGTVQEGRTHSIIESLKQFIRSRCIVIRDGKQEVVPEYDLVTGDLIVLQAGERVPADARIIHAHQLEIDESMLTGESMPAIKQTDSLLGNDLVLGDQTNMAFKGTYILAGIARAVVVATGLQTQVGKIHQSVEEIKTDIPLTQELRRLSWWILIFIFVICLSLLFVGVLFGRGWQELIAMLTALFICVIPEGLPVVLTLVLVSGAYRMAEKKVLAKNLQGVEGLGRTDVIVTDKTGTLTRNEMIVTDVMTHNGYYQVSGQGYHARGDIMKDGHVIVPGQIDDESLDMIGLAGALLNNTELSYDKRLNIFHVHGDPTQAAIGILAQKLGHYREGTSFINELYEIPFDSLRRFQAGFYDVNGRGQGFLLGAPELLMGVAHNFSPQYEDALRAMLDRGLRVIAVGTVNFDMQTWDQNNYNQFERIAKQGIQLLGFCGIQDAIRPEVHRSIEQSRQAGLHILMATGDHLLTAIHVARTVGIFEEGDEAIDGKKFDNSSDEEILSRLDRITVFARVNPHHKVRIVQLFHKKGLIVAMTGDGVNDVPSLVAADLGIAMGGIGTEVAKQAADLVLLDDSFVNIINGIQEGRHIFYTLRRVVLYFFSTNCAEILVVLVVLFTRLPLPLLVSQILWLNFVTDGFLDVGLSFERPEKGLLSPLWLQTKMRLIDISLVVKMFFMALPMSMGSLGVFAWYYNMDHDSLPYARTMGLLTLVMYQWFNAWNCRSERLSIIQSGIFSNRWFLAAASFVFVLQICLVYAPWMQMLFKTTPLSFYDWLIIIGVTSPIILIEETRKFVMRTNDRIFN